MKKLILLLSAFAALAFVSCSKDDNNDPGPVGPVVCPKDHVEVVSFEPSEQLADFLGEKVVLGDVTVVGGSAAATHHNAFWAGLAMYADYMQTNDKGSTSFDNALFGTADGNIWFGSYYSDNKEFGGQFDSWGGFALTANFEKTAKDADIKKQFTIWADKGANGSATCMIGFDNSYMNSYGKPTIELIEPRKACHLYMANTAMTYPYKPGIVSAAAYYYKVAVIGSLKGVETGRVECMLINGGVKAEDWVFVDLSALGEVDTIKFEAMSNEANSYGLLAPSYFAVDEIGFAK